MHWLFKPKVQLGLFVNFVFILFTCVTSTHSERPHAYSFTTTVPAPVVPYAPPPPPPAAPSGATVVDLGGGRANVLLTKDLTLVKKPGRTLLLSPSFNIDTWPAEPPTTVTLSFIIFSDEEACPGACMLVIDADGSHVWESAAAGTFSTGWTRVKNPATNMTLPDGQVAVTLAAETLTTEIPYKTFLDIVSARRVVLSLGPDKAELTHDQKEALRDMRRRVATPTVVEQRGPKIIKTF
jgi:hypothetical protein